MAPAEQLARFGTEVSRGLAADLAAVAAPLMADPAAKSIFGRPDGRPKLAGETLVQPELAALLGQMRRAGVGDLYSGAMAQKFIDAAGQAGGGITAADLRAAMPRQAPALSIEGPDEATVSFLPAPADGGVAAAAAYRVLASDASALRVAKERALAAAAESRGTGALGALSASTSFAVIDSEGNAVACALTMGNLFGTGRMAQGTGVLLAASPSAQSAPLLSAAESLEADFEGRVAGSESINSVMRTASGMPVRLGRSRLEFCCFTSPCGSPQVSYQSKPS